MVLINTVEPYTLKDFYYSLPSELIAKYPLPERHSSKMMLLNRKKQSLSHHHFYDLSEFLEPGDILILNNSKVIPARLHGYREGCLGQVELFLMNPKNSDKTVWEVLMKPSKRLKLGTIVIFKDTLLKARIVERLQDGKGVIEFKIPKESSFEELITTIGKIPIPPYLEREAEEIDSERYQTIFAKVKGAQAAPTAGLHFTKTVLEQLQNKGVNLAEITLHVSAGTFRPVLNDNIEEHIMDPEYYSISNEVADIIRQTKANGKRVVAIGTTVAKTLETSASLNNGIIQAGSGWSNIFIKPGFKFKVTDALLTNFHLPESTLIMLISAFAGRDFILKSYKVAVEEQYRFYSYGDCMFIK